MRLSKYVIIQGNNDNKENIENKIVNNDEREDKNMDIDLFKEDEEIKEVVKDINNEKVTSIFENFDTKDEQYVSYYVHIIRDNDNIDSITSKYNVTIDDLKEYNNIDQITLGNKIIIPYKNNETI